MHDRRARPTLRLVQGELAGTWDDPWPSRCVAEGRLDDLHPLAALPHPLVTKAAKSFGGPDGDSYHEKIKTVERIVLWEVRAGQWRGAIYQDESSGVYWLCAAGLAKGDHKDRDDFYEVLGRMDNDEIDALLPTEDDILHLKRETASARLTQWELDIQQKVHDALITVGSSGSTRIAFDDPLGKRRFGTVEITTDTFDEPGYLREECVVEFDLEPRYRSTDLGWRMAQRVLISICPPVQGWDRTGDMYSTILDVGGLAARITALKTEIASGKLATLALGDVAHYTHRKHLAENTVEGRAVRALCGVFFVPMQDHARFDPCPECDRVRETIPETTAALD